HFAEDDARRVPDLAGIDDESVPLRLAQRDLHLAGLIGRQRPDGGWAWRDDVYCQTDPNVAARVLIALGEAQRDGLVVDPSVVRNSTSIIFGEVNRPTDIAYPPDINQRAFLLYALASAGARGPVSVTARALFEQYRIQLGNW